MRYTKVEVGTDELVLNQYEFDEFKNVGLEYEITGEYLVVTSADLVQLELDGLEVLPLGQQPITYDGIDGFPIYGWDEWGNPILTPQW